MYLHVLWSPLFIAAQFAVAMALYAKSQPRRDRFAQRVAISAAVYLSATMAVTWIGFVQHPSLMGTYALPSQILAFSALAVAWVAIVYFCFDLSPTGAAFIAIAGYSTQNLANSVEGVVQIVKSELSGLWPVDAQGQIVGSIVGVTADGLVISIISTVVVYGACYPLFARKLSGAWAGKPNDLKIAVVFGAVLFLEIALDLTLKSIFGLEMSTGQRIILSAAKPMLCLFILFAEFQILIASRTASDAEALRRFMYERERQYELQRGNIEAINVKVHDIKHQIRSLTEQGGSVDNGALTELAHEVRVFDTDVRTGNEAVDIILTEKSLACEREHITLSCIVDGRILGFMPESEIYALFGNALDNAIEAARGIDDPRRRSISLIVNERAGMASIHVENYFDGSVEFRGGLPVTSTGDYVNHGFGTRSMQLIAEAHDGVFSASATGGVFYVNILIPLPQDGKAD